MNGVEAAIAKLNASIHVDGFAMKDFEISFLFKRNNLEVSRKKKNRSGNVIRAASANLFT